MTEACDSCLRRADLLANIADRLEIEFRRRRKRSEVLALTDEELLAIDTTDIARHRYARFDPAAYRRAVADAGLTAICHHSADDPVIARLSDLVDPPAVVFTSSLSTLRGVVERGAVGVVGARHASAYGLEVARSLARRLADAGVPVVSGMALGIDSAAHLGALDGGGTTVAVLGGGADVPYPARGRSLHARIRETGALVSELGPGIRPRRWTFPARNRLIAALSSVVVVVEGAERSGSLITADFAAELGRVVGAVPGPVTARLSAGVNSLLRSGAAPIRGVDDVLDELSGAGVEVVPRLPRPAPVPADLDGGSLALLEAIAHGNGTVAALCRGPGEVSTVLQRLAALELRGLIRQEGTGRYVRAL